MFVFLVFSCCLAFAHGQRVCDSNLTEDSALLQRKMSDSARHGTWAYPRDWRSGRDLANVTNFPLMLWGKVGKKWLGLSFFSAVPVFGPDGNYIALLHEFTKDEPVQYFLETGKLALFCSGPKGSHRTKVRIVGNETTASYKMHLVFVCDWPQEDQHLERFEVSLDDGHGNYIGTVVAEQKNGLLQQYGTVACVRDVYPSKTTGLRLLPSWLEFHRLHGIDHFIIYTVNVDSEVLVDAYEPYIASGAASRVHFHQDAIGDLTHHQLHHLWAMADCLYRAKNHAKWLLPSIDIDEYFNMKGSRLFFQQSVPSDYLASAWDAIVKAKNMTNDQVHSIVIPSTYRFAPAEVDQVELRSVRRDPDRQPTLPKYVLNVKTTKTVFVHWVTSYENNTRALSIDEKIGVLHHYRKAPESYNVANPLSYKDESMLQYVPELERSMKNRFQVPDVTQFLHRFRAATEGEVLLPGMTGIEAKLAIGPRDREALATNDLKVLAWARSIWARPGIQLVSPPES